MISINVLGHSIRNGDAAFLGVLLAVTCLLIAKDQVFFAYL